MIKARPHLEVSSGTVPNQLQYLTHSAWPVAALALDYEHLVGGVDGCPAKGAQRVSGLLQLLRTRLAHALVATGDDDVVLGRVEAQHALILRIIGVRRGCRRS